VGKKLDDAIVALDGAVVLKTRLCDDASRLLTAVTNRDFDYAEIDEWHVEYKEADRKHKVAGEMLVAAIQEDTKLYG
jgi:hypothetical protein